MLKQALITLLLAAVAATAAAETVYKWVDVRGQVHYSDRPPSEAGARVLSVFQRPAGFDEEEGDEPPVEPTTPMAPAGGSDDRDPAAERAAAAAVQRDLAAVRGEQCQKAQERYRQYIESQRLFRVNAAGEREYLTEAELGQARVEARRAVDEACGPGRT